MLFCLCSPVGAPQSLGSDGGCSRGEPVQHSFLGNFLRANTVEAMGDTKPKLSPAEYSGDTATSVCVVAWSLCVDL